ncbi:MAG: Asp-tRNA(Asn)/Glu-tRNA(Gln) amidotransferase GatCAB subunit C [Acidimicrobiaceae bacterium]|jgi:aspartyl-tRNA(Asn)/glutamyl-tRNA(Gln) amidotransferase subunit C|nr:Asp-tRNA(Asn)/Glu-tRNA(Gln) amidotransferase GatCAB subunit C [Acidimicrobiaceae bacterium]|tara:strand:- start:1503 stop:1808 length:306 start_codon:yes stop_codon:yes gene_type:complete
MMTEPISEKEVAHVAHLARLRLSDDELGIFTRQLGAVLEHAKDVEALQLDGVEPMSHPFPLENVTREDEVGEMLDRDKVLDQAPAAEDGRFQVPQILGDQP